MFRFKLYHSFDPSWSSLLGSLHTLLGRIGPSRAAYALVMVPVVALGLSTLFEDFTWKPHIFIGVGLILMGNIIILTRKKEKKVVNEEFPILKKAA